LDNATTKTILLKIIGFRDKMAYSMVKIRRFGETSCLHIQVKRGGPTHHLQDYGSLHARSSENVVSS